MMERSKSIVLAVLVLLSLVQSFLLAYSMPNFDVVKRAGSTYIKADPLGPEEKVDNLIYPEHMVLHLGGNKHTIMDPGTIFFNFIMKRLQGRSYDGFQLKSGADLDWAAIQEKKQGLELRFNSPVPAKLLQKVLPISEDAAFQTESIYKVWLYASEELNEVRVFFFTAEDNRIYESTRADLSVQDVKQLVEFGSSGTPYRLVNGTFYVPQEPIEMVEVKLPYTVFSPEQMQRSLFFDPTLTKIIQENDGSKIYTDGKRGLQVQRNQLWITYSDATAPTEERTDMTSDVMTSVNFINQRGGWSGRFRLSVMENMAQGSPGIPTLSGTHNRLVFQQYWGSYPIISTKDTRFGYVQVTLQQGMVMNYERSLIQLGAHADEKQIKKLIAGEPLIAQLKKLSKYALIAEINPVYEPSMSEEQIRLHPVWQVKYTDGTTELLEP
ncbi:two-component system activity regulator YycH [Paenibacillus sp. ACRRX]|uniref:YycH family regulatory protein n=1 Tax=Paenibacillus sp. ACRRX TaxID=2918206 RepID=UPI001EF6A03C|nr:two-component system activity regulator YycH [Paenibacillus sp. ACRRX]MCG7408358.1 two-component system activity regulator YycH [Paenibacillus sp. ACRRX]